MFAHKSEVNKQILLSYNYEDAEGRAKVVAEYRLRFVSRRLAGLSSGFRIISRKLWPNTKYICIVTVF